MEDMVSNHGDKKFNPNSDLRQTQSSDVRKSINSRYDHKYSGRLQPIASCCSLVGLGLAESSSMMDSNTEPTTPPTKLDASYDSTPPRTPSKSSVCISRSDADNVHLTIANMAALHQNLSPTLTTCNSWKSIPSLTSFRTSLLAVKNARHRFEAIDPRITHVYHLICTIPGRTSTLLKAQHEPKSFRCQEFTYTTLYDVLITFTLDLDR